MIAIVTDGLFIMGALAGVVLSYLAVKAADLVAGSTLS